MTISGTQRRGDSIQTKSQAGGTGRGHTRSLYVGLLCVQNGGLAVGQKEPQVTLPGGLEPVPMSFRRAQLHCINTAEPFQLLPTGPLAFPLSSITWGNYQSTNRWLFCQVSHRIGGKIAEEKNIPHAPPWMIQRRVRCGVRRCNATVRRETPFVCLPKSELAALSAVRPQVALLHYRTFPFEKPACNLPCFIRVPESPGLVRWFSCLIDTVL